MNRVVIFGASRGLGAELAKQIAGLPAGPRVLGFSRNEAALVRLQEQAPSFEYRLADFSTATGQETALRYLAEEPADKVFCIAGGGPFGLFHEHEWRSHQWAWEVSFLFPARVAHFLRRLPRPQQLVFVGSAVAESSPDPKAASYCAAKHALKGLFGALKQESPNWDVRLFSPGYMDTEMLPANAAVRQKGVYAPGQIAQDLWQWSLSADESGHKLYPVHPGC